MKIQQKLIINHKFNNGTTSQMIFYMVTINMIFMHTIVSVNTTKIGSAAIAETETTILTKTPLDDLNKNPIIVQQQRQKQQQQQSTQIPTSSSSASTSSSYSSSSLSLPSSLTLLSTYHLSEKTMAEIPTSPQLNNVMQKQQQQSKDISIAELLAAVAVKSPTASAAAAPAPHACKSLNGVWGDVDPNIFYICDANTQKPLQLRCPEGRGFFLGLGYSGCIPYEQWPACVSLEHLEQVTVCDSEHMQQPWETMNPNKFYVCLKETIEPTMLNCEPGKGFVHAVVNGGATSEIVGCANWEKWRSYMQCNDYY